EPPAGPRRALRPVPLGGERPALLHRAHVRVPGRRRHRSPREGRADAGGDRRPEARSLEARRPPGHRAAPAARRSALRVVGPLGSVARTALWVASCLVVAAACLPGFYLLLRAGEVDARAWAGFFGGRSLELLGSTLSLAFAVTLAATLIALPLAWLTTLSDLPGRRAFTVLLCLPLAVPSFIHGYALLAAFGDGGLLDGWGAPRPRIYGFWGATFALTFSTFPFSFLAFRAALLRQDGSLLEAARSLGASPFEAFARVTLPQLLQAFRASGLLVAFY